MVPKNIYVGFLEELGGWVAGSRIWRKSSLGPGVYQSLSAISRIFFPGRDRLIETINKYTSD